MNGDNVPLYPGLSSVIEMILVFSGLQVRPQMKWVSLGSVHGSEEKFQELRHEEGGIDEGFIEDLKDFSADMSD